MEEKKFPVKGKKASLKMKLMYSGYNTIKEPTACKQKNVDTERQVLNAVTVGTLLGSEELDHPAFNVTLLPTHTFIVTCYIHFLCQGINYGHATTRHGVYVGRTGG
jgi:hypothetical protein